MGKKNKQKIKKSILLKDLPSHLRKLANLIDKGKVPFASKDLTFSSISSFKLSLKYKDYIDIVESKITIEPLDVSVDPNERKLHHKTLYLATDKNKKKPSYKKLKKSMNARYTYIVDCLDKDLFPEQDILENFYHESELMTLYPGKGDEYYEDYLKSVKSLKEHVVEKDLKASQRALAKITYIMKECHRIHK